MSAAVRGGVAITLALGLYGSALAQTPSKAIPKITSITVDPSIPVVGPDHVTSINVYPNFGLSTLADEHSTIFSPSTLPKQSDYLFFVATRTTLNPMESGLVVLKARREPARDEPWSLNYAHAFGLYDSQGLPGARNGQLLETAMAHLNCPSGGTFDPTFDLNYGAPGTVFLDPANPKNKVAGNVLMLYEGSNRCIGLTGTTNSGNSFYSALGIATSQDHGVSWPLYKANFTALPDVNQT